MIEGKFGLLGRKLGHSFSPEIHGQIGEYTQAYEYKLYEVEPEKLEEFIIHGDWTGLNVTIPYKKDVMKFCDYIASEAQRIGAVNTLVKRDGKIYGYNTDYFGFRKTVEESGAKVEGSKCAVLGSGGASATAVTVLSDLKAAEVIVVSRDGKTGCDYETLVEKHGDVEIMVNTTPVGMYPNEGVSPVKVSVFKQLKNIFDLVYNPLRTEFLCQGKMAGVKGASGLKMLVGQAKVSAEYFFDMEIDDNILEPIERKLVEQKENIVLIGMPGCGKSSIGKILSKKTGRKLIDLDELIVEKAGKTIPEIFEESGEAGFRAIESQVVEAVSKECSEGSSKGISYIIACGGGVITRDINYSPLAANGKIVFINRKVEVLPVEGRPLSQTTPLQEMYEKRLPLYKKWSDEEYMNEGVTLEELAETIMGNI